MKQLFCSLLVCLCTVYFPFATIAQPSLFSPDKYTNGKGDTLYYQRLWPDADTFRKYPLVIFLHGSGERGNDNVAQLKWGVPNFATDRNMKLHPCIVIAPQCPPGLTWSNTKSGPNYELTLQPAPSKPMQLLIELIQQAKKNYPVDTSRIYITGLSMGGYGTFDAVERNPGLFAAAVPVCGGGDTARAATIAKIPMWIFGGADDPAVSPVYSINMAAALRKAGARPGLTIYPEVGHFSWIEAYSDEMMMEWLFRQHK